MSYEEYPAMKECGYAVRPKPRRRILVGCVGNVLRRDDGFGPAVASRLDRLPPGVRVVETGIGGVALLQELLEGWDGLVVVDAVDRDAEPGTIFTITPEVGEAVHVPDVHLANPERVLTMAKAVGALPERVLIVGCQPAEVDELGDGLSPAVERAVGAAAVKVEEAVRAWL
jgi:hydrogenase maturation protease